MTTISAPPSRMPAQIEGSATTPDQPSLLPMTARSVQWTAGVVVVIVGAIVLRFAGLSAIALWGDEYGSLDEATSQMGSNLTSLVYSLVLRLFISVGRNEFILRLPAAIF